MQSPIESLETSPAAKIRVFLIPLKFKLIEVYLMLARFFACFLKLRDDFNLDLLVDYVSFLFVLLRRMQFIVILLV